MENIVSFLRRTLRRDKSIWKIDLLIIVVFIIIIIIISVWQPSLPGREDIDEALKKYGSFGPLAIIGVIIIEVIIAPIPGGLIPVAAGALYGVWLGSLYVWIGNVTGSIIVFWLARKLAQPIVKKFISKDKVDHFNKFLNRNKIMVWLVYIIPIFPIDIVSIVLGLSHMKFRRFFEIVTIGFVIHILSLTFLGERILVATGTERILYLIAIMFVVVIGFTVEKIIYRESR